MTKRALFALLPAVVLAGGIELGFRAFFVGTSTVDYLAKAGEPGAPDGTGYYWLYTSDVNRVRSRSSPRPPSVDENDDSLIRIVTIGGSSAAGYPYEPRLAFSNVLRVMLEQMYPSGRFQIINLARFAAPYALAAQAYIDVAHLRPRFLLVYSGHNEIYPHNLAQVVERRSRSAWGRALTSMAESLGSRSRAFGWLLDRAETSSYSVPDGFDPFEHLGEMLTNYIETTARLHAAAQEAGTTIFTGTLVSNFKDFPPTAYPDTVAEAFTPLAKERFDALPESERRDPVPLYRLARWYDAEGELELAEKRFVDASDRVTRLARVHSSVQAWIEQIEDFYPETVLIEAEHVVRDAVGGRLVGDGEIFDWVHPKLATSYLIASAYTEALKPRLDAVLGPASSVAPELDVVKQRLADHVGSLEADGVIEAGFVNLQVGRPDIATELFDRGLKASPSPPMAAKAHLGVALVRVRHGELDQARAALAAIDDEARTYLDSALSTYRQLDGFDQLRAMLD